MKFFLITFKVFIVNFIFNLLFISLVFGTESSSTSNDIKRHFEASLTDGFDKNGFIILGLGTASALLTNRYDNKIVTWFSKNKLISSDLEKFGYEIGADGRMLVGALSHILINQSNGIAHLESYLATGSSVEVMKITAHRSRPNKNGHKSFPSGHVAVVTTSATSLSYSYGWKIGVPAFTIATLTFISRLQSNGHWLSDNIIGATVGIFWARATAFHHGNLQPIITQKTFGAIYAFEF